MIQAQLHDPTMPRKEGDLFEHASAMGFGDIHFKIDPESGLRSIIAIHSTRLGPALGGCRYISYPDTNAALQDVMNLARGMSYKAAMAGLPLGGGKAVIIHNDQIESREALFEAYGRFVDELGGRYISSVDSGTGPEDMDIAARHTQYLRSTSAQGDPSPWTAMGVRRGIEAAVQHRLNRDNLDGIHVAIQGTGHVGYHLAKELHQLGAKLTVTDMLADHVARCVEEFGATAVNPDEIYSVNADVFAPCALGGAINPETLNQLQVSIVAGAANNVLADTSQAVALHEKGILYAPDYVINAGGLMQVWIEDEQALRDKINTIHDTLSQLFERAASHQLSPAVVVDYMAEEILYGNE